jgi:8-oxo-dGTP diphosphatase
VRTAAYRLALTLFRRSPVPLRRAAVRLGTPNYTVGAVCALVHDGAVLMLRQRHRDDWALPGGLLDRGETPDEAVRRELREETGLSMDVGLPVTALVDPDVRRVDVIYRIDLPERVKVRPRGEAFHAEWLRPDQLDEGSAATLAVLDLLFRTAVPGATDSRLAGT